MLLGIDNIRAKGFRPLRGARIGVFTNIASCDAHLQPTIEVLCRQKKFRVALLFTPEHGLHGALQDQKQSRDFYDRQHKLWVYSLYGKRLVPDEKILNRIDAVLIDIQDVGTRYYTFVWSAVLMMQQMARLKKRVIITDRPNPLNGVSVQGPVLDEKYSSFVGLFPIPIRHGLTIAELCHFIATEFAIKTELTIIAMKGWRRRYYYSDTKLQWTMPSPNMPTFATASVYPGMCLLEGTNISEGRGTTRPFELFGAPWIDPFRLVQTLKKRAISGAAFRPTYFMPTFHKYRGIMCGGAHLYITNKKRFNPVSAGLQIIKTVRDLYPRRFAWRQPPYEFEKKRMPFDILIGNSWIRTAIEHGASIAELERRWQSDLQAFKKKRKKYLLYH
jgi:uncharacterized protein YbbC (DUF1343 family)